MVVSDEQIAIATNGNFGAGLDVDRSLFCPDRSKESKQRQQPAARHCLALVRHALERTLQAISIMVLHTQTVAATKKSLAVQFI